MLAATQKYSGHPLQYSWPRKPHGRRSLVGCSPWGRKESDTTEWLHFHFSLSYIGEGNGNPLQRSYLKNPRDGGAWWAAIYGVAQSRTQLKRLSSSHTKIQPQRSASCCQVWRTLLSYLATQSVDQYHLGVYEQCRIWDPHRVNESESAFSWGHQVIPQAHEYTHLVHPFLTFKDRKASQGR